MTSTVLRLPGGRPHQSRRTLLRTARLGFPRMGNIWPIALEERPGFEADRWQIVIMTHGGKPRSITKEFDGSPTEIVWGPHSDRIYFTAEEKARSPIFSVSVADGAVTRIYEGHTLASLSISRDGSSTWLSRKRPCSIPPKSASSIPRTGHQRRGTSAKPIRGFLQSWTCPSLKA